MNGLIAGALMVLAYASASQPLPVPPPVPPPVEQSAADCVAPVYATDILVCGDPALREMDRRMVTLMKTAGPLPQSDWLEPQGNWLRRRSLCAFQLDHRACAIGAYSERLAILAAVKQGTRGAIPYRCAEKQISQAVFADERVTLSESAGGPVLIAFAPGTHAPSQDYATFRATPRSIRISALGGRSLTCSLKK